MVLLFIFGKELYCTGTVGNFYGSLHISVRFQKLLNNIGWSRLGINGHGSTSRIILFMCTV
jgi:hypothetical protein